MKDLKEKISIIMPAYNEESYIQNSIEETAKTFNNFGCSWELVVIDDGSTDTTFEKAQSLVKRYPQQLIVKKNPFNLGKGRAMKKAAMGNANRYQLPCIHVERAMRTVNIPITA